MVSSLKKASAVLISLVCVLTMSSFALVPQAQANTGHWYFSFSKADGVHKCGPVTKNTGTTYVDVSIKKSADNSFVVGKSVLGLRTRRTTGEKASKYYKFKHYHDSFHMDYINGKSVAGKAYNLRGQVDSTSQTNIIQVWGYWTP